MTTFLVMERLASLSLHPLILRLVRPANDIEPAIGPMDPVISRGDDISILLPGGICEGPSGLNLVQSPRDRVDTGEPSSVVKPGTNVVDSDNVEEREEPSPSLEFLALTEGPEEQSRLVLGPADRSAEGSCGIIINITEIFQSLDGSVCIGLPRVVPKPNPETVQSLAVSDNHD